MTVPVQEKHKTFVLNSIAECPANVAFWVRMTDLREKLYARGLSRAMQDAILRELSRTRLISLAPDSAQMHLTAADHEAAIRIGDDYSHQVQAHA